MPQSKNTRKAKQAKRLYAEAEARYNALRPSQRRRFRDENPKDPVAGMMAIERRRARQDEIHHSRRPQISDPFMVMTPPILDIHPWMLMNGWGHPRR